MIKIKKIVLSDINEITDLINRNLSENIVPFFILTDLYETYNKFNYVSIYKDLIIGCILCIVNNNILVCNFLVIDFPYTRNGIGKHLLKSVIDEAQNNNIECIQLYCRSSNLSALNFYINQGFKIIKENIPYYEDGVHGNLMELNLKEDSFKI